MLESHFSSEGDPSIYLAITFYTLVIVTDIIVMLISFLWCTSILNYLICGRKKIENKKWGQLNNSEEKTKFIQNIFLLLIGLAQGLHKIFDLIHLSFLLFHLKTAKDVQLTENCAIDLDTTISIYYNFGPQGIIFSVGLSYFFNMVFFILLIGLLMYLTRVYNELQQFTRVWIYVITSLFVSSVVFILLPIIQTYQLAYFLFVLLLVVKFIFLAISSNQFYRALKKKNKLSPFNEQHISAKEKNDSNLRKIFAKFATIMLIFVGFYISGLFFEFLCVDLIGTLIRNSCWWFYIYGIQINIAEHPNYRFFEKAMIYFKLTACILFNVALICMYLCYAVCTCITNKNAKKLHENNHTTASSKDYSSFHERLLEHTNNFQDSSQSALTYAYLY